MSEKWLQDEEHEVSETDKHIWDSLRALVTCNMLGIRKKRVSFLYSSWAVQKFTKGINVKEVFMLVKSTDQRKLGHKYNKWSNQIQPYHIAGKFWILKTFGSDQLFLGTSSREHCFCAMDFHFQFVNFWKLSLEGYSYQLELKSINPQLICFCGSFRLKISFIKIYNAVRLVSCLLMQMKFLWYCYDLEHVSAR